MEYFRNSIIHNFFISIILSSSSLINYYMSKIIKIKEYNVLCIKKS